MLPISVCMIAKNEEKKLDRCLRSLAPYGFEIVIVDTGSTDRTKEIAAQYTSSVYDFTWVDDFSAARNFSLEKAANDWIFMMDCDEWIESIDTKELMDFRRYLSHAVGSITRHNLTGTPENPGETVDRTERFFNRRQYYYTGKIHEQITRKNGKDMEVYLLNTTIGHDGYRMTEEERQKKAYRNISLLEQEYAADPCNPYLLYQLGKGYDLLCDYEKSVPYYEKALTYDLDFTLAYVQALVVAYAEALLGTGQYKKALDLRKYMPFLSGNADFIYILGLIAKKNELYEDALDCFEKALTLPTATKPGRSSYLCYFEIGSILVMIAEWQTARRYFAMCGDYPPALRSIQILDENGL